MVSARRHSRAKKNTVIMPLSRKLHHSQLAAIPCRATWPVTQSGVSAAKVVATIEVPASHHVTWRPETKKSLVDRKSTRLNSSHLVISYAVFCLKKKNHRKFHQRERN